MLRQFSLLKKTKGKPKGLKFESSKKLVARPANCKNCGRQVIGK